MLTLVQHRDVTCSAQRRCKLGAGSSRGTDNATNGLEQSCDVLRDDVDQTLHPSSDSAVVVVNALCQQRKHSTVSQQKVCFDVEVRAITMQKAHNHFQPHTRTPTNTSTLPPTHPLTPRTHTRTHLVTLEPRLMRLQEAPFHNKSNCVQGAPTSVMRACFASREE